MASQLLAIRWQTNSRGLIQIESKDDMTRRGVSSPDRADALAMAVARRHGGGAGAVFLVDNSAYEEDLALGQLGSGGTLGNLTRGLLDMKPSQW